MGSTASASIGIAISHHIQPLIKAIGHAFDACHERAKRVPGKDAIAVEVLKRGGAPVTAVSHFHGPGPGPGIADTIAEAVDLLSDAGPDSLSAGVPHELAKDEPVISQLPLAAQVAELGRVLDRQSGAMPEGSEERRRLEDLGDRLKGLLNPETLALSYTELVNWLLVARFLACEGGDD
jgi:hypothetical protein